VLSGTPTGSGSSSFDVRATDAAGCTVQRSYTLNVQSTCVPIAVLPATLPGASVGIAYSQTLTASAGTAPFTFAVTAGAPPAGFTLTSAGVLSGTAGAPGTAGFTVQATDANGCTGSTSYSLTSYVVPTAITTLVTQQVTSGNAAGTTTGVRVSFTLPAAASSAEIYRAPFGGYPSFGGGVVPAVPSYPPGAPWSLTPVVNSGDTDTPPGRDYWYYVAFAKNPAGGVSGVSNRTGGALDYHLGDFADGVTPGHGDNRVNTIDVSLLGAHYGLQGAAVAPYSYLDVGPTSDHTVNGRPLPDQLIGFEDLVLVAINFDVASAPPVAHAIDGAPGAVTRSDELAIEAPIRVLRGQSVVVPIQLHGAGDLQALSVRLGWDPAVVTPESWTSGGYVESRGGVVLSPGLGGVDAAVLGAHTGGLAGDGTLATLRFRAVGDGDPRFRAASLDGRDANNASIAVKGVVTAPVPTADGLSFAMPNPSRDLSTLEMGLAHPAVVDLAIFDLDGRRVRTLASGAWQAGLYRMAWDGLDDRGHHAPAGMYFARLSAGGAGYTRRVVRL
jgi:hypothetical protein